jgi:hypothetical protein
MSQPAIRHRTHFVPATRLALALIVIAGWSVDAQKALDVAGVRLDEAFRLAGSNSMGLVVSVTVNDLKPHTTTDNFHVRLFDEAGRPSGDLACLAMRPLADGDGPKSPWILLDRALSSDRTPRSWRRKPRSFRRVDNAPLRKRAGTNSSSSSVRRRSGARSCSARIDPTSRVFLSDPSRSRGHSRARGGSGKYSFIRD